MKKKVCSFFLGLISVFLCVVGVICLLQRVSVNENIKSDVCFAAAALAMPDGKAEDNGEVSTVTAPKQTENNQSKVVVATADEPPHSYENADLHEDEVHYPVIESTFGESGVKVSNFYIKDALGVGTDFENMLRLPLGFEIDNSDEPQVLIFHTHTTESYLEYDEGYYHESFYSRSNDETKNMVSVGEKIAESLREKGIGVIHAKEVHDSPEYSGAYYRSWDTITEYMEKYPSIKVVLDIHRDSIAGDDGSKVKPVFEVEGKKAAQIMIMAGSDIYDQYDFEDWEYNLRFALKLQECAEEMYPGMTRPLYFGDFAYNMPISRGSLLIEMGTEVNTLQEAQYTGKLLGNVLAKVLQREG